jgi:uncharacterized YigZ family protein
MAVTSFFTLDKPSQGLYKEKGSKFLAFAYPVRNEDEIKEKLDALRKEYYDARHHCYAWILGPERLQFRANDDGEPNHSAGDPILGQIRSKNLTNVLIVVVRYFGGTKLGVGGLIAAYKAAAEDALRTASIIEEEVRLYMELEFQYENTNEVMRLVKEFELKLVQQQFDIACHLSVQVSLSKWPVLEPRLKLMNDLGVPLTVTVRNEP